METPSTLLKRQALSLENQDDLAWTAEISIGSNNQMFTIEFDTAFSDLWVPLTECIGCDGHSTYNPTTSTTSRSRPQGVGVLVMFGNGVQVLGPLFSDTGEISHLKPSSMNLFP